MDLLAILGIGALIRLLRRRGRDHTTVPTALDTPASIAPFIPLSPRALRGDVCLLLRAARGLILAALLMLAALEPWPTAWAMSVLLAPAAHAYQLWALQHVDVVTAGAVATALIEPLLLMLLRGLRLLTWRLWRGLRATPRTLARIARICWLLLMLFRWRMQCCRLRSWQQRISLAA